MNKNILICGVGGQGTVLASKLIASAFSAKGENVHSAETIGMAQRGGSVTSHVRVGESYAPLIPYGGADIILAFEPAEAVRNLIYLKPGGMVITNSVSVKPSSDSLSKGGYEAETMTEYLRKKCDCIIVDGSKVTAKAGSSKFFNTALLGVAISSGKLGLEREDILNAIDNKINKKFAEANKSIFIAAAEGEFI